MLLKRIKEREVSNKVLVKGVKETMLNGIKLVCLSANKELTEKIAEILDVPVMDSEVTHFADGEILFEGKQSFRGDKVYVIQSTCAPVSERLMELLVCCDALKRASAKEITAVIPYFGYARQDRKAKARQPITARLVADLLQVAGVNRVVATDLHAPQIQGFFNCPVDDVSAIPVFVKYFEREKVDNIVVVSPDHGGVVRARKFAEKLGGAPIAIIDKRRPKPNVAQVVSVVGDVKDKNVIIIDDIVDTAGTLCQAAKTLKDMGAIKVYAAISHGVLSLDAVDRINNSCLEKLIITDSIPLPADKQSNKIVTLSMAPLFAKIIEHIEHGKSLSDAHKEYLKSLK